MSAPKAILRVPGHALQGGGAAYDFRGPVKESGTGGPGYGRCMCGALSPRESSAAKRKAWHRGHKEAVLEAAALESAGLIPSKVATIWTNVTPPTVGIALIFDGFGDGGPETFVQAAISKGETHHDLAFRALTILTGILPADEPVKIMITHGHSRSIVVSNRHLLPKHWHVSQNPVSKAAFDRAYQAFIPERAATIAAVDKDFPLPARGTQTQIIIGTDASAKPGRKKDASGITLGTAGVGWVIGGLDPGTIMAGHRKVEERTMKIEELELTAIADALQVVANHPYSKKRWKHVTRVLVMSDSAPAVNLLNRSKGSTLELVAQIQELVGRLRAPVEFCWVKGHANNPWNTAADSLSRLGLANSTSKEAKQEIVAKLQASLREKRDDQYNRLHAEREERLGPREPVPAAAINFLATRARNRSPEMQYGQTA